MHMRVAHLAMALLTYVAHTCMVAALYHFAHVHVRVGECMRMCVAYLAMASLTYLHTAPTRQSPAITHDAHVYLCMQSTQLKNLGAVGLLAHPPGVALVVRLRRKICTTRYYKCVPTILVSYK